MKKWAVVHRMNAPLIGVQSQEMLTEEQWRTSASDAIKISLLHDGLIKAVVVVGGGGLLCLKGTEAKRKAMIKKWRLL